MTDRPASPSVTRRSVLATAAAATATAASISTTFAPLMAAESPGGGAKRGFKIGVCEWMFGRGNPTSYDAAKEIGVDGMQLNMGNVANDMHLRKPEVQQAYLAAAKRTGLAVSSIGAAEMNNVPLKSDPRAAEWLHDSVDVAKALGVQVILLAFFAKGDLLNGKELDKAAVDHVVELLKREAPRAEKEGVILGIESWLNVEQHLHILDRVKSPAVQVYYDVGNMHLRGYDIYAEIRQLGAKRICEVHAKDYGHIFGQGKVDFKEVRKAFDDIGYRGWIQIEGATDKAKGQIETFKLDRAYLKEVFPADA